MDFKPLSENELDRLSDDELIAHIVGARDAGDNDQARKALGILGFRRWADVRRRVAMKVPAADVDDVASEALASAIRASFAGESVGEFVNLLHTITDRRIVDYHRKREGKPREDPLPEDHQEAEDVWGEGAIDDDFSKVVDVRAVIEQAMGELSEAHQRVVDLYVFERAPAKETAEGVNIDFGEDLDTKMTEANVHQIGKRFRDRLRELLEEAGGGT